MKKEILKDYLESGKLNIDRIIDDFYGYVYVVVKNSVSIAMTDEDIEEIISDTFVALWKNADNLEITIEIKPYLLGIIRNVIKNKYRKSNINFGISDYENILISNIDIHEIIEENEQNNIIQKTLKNLKQEEYQIFIMFYYEAKTIKEIAKSLKCSQGKVKVILHRVRKKLKKKLEDGGYGYGK